MKKAVILFLLILSSSAQALNNVNLTVDSGSIQLCISEKYLQNQTCNTTHPLILDGTKDHMLYITPQMKVKYHEGDYQANMQNYFFYYISEPVYVTYALIFILGIIFTGLFIEKWLMARINRFRNCG